MYLKLGMCFPNMQYGSGGIDLPVEESYVECNNGPYFKTEGALRLCTGLWGLTLGFCCSLQPWGNSVMGENPELDQASN
jgi:hypothetical protein